VISISIKFELQPRASVDANHEVAQHFEDVFAVCNLVGVLESFTGSRNDLGKPSIALSPDLYHRINMMRWADTDQSVAQVVLQQAPHVSALTAEYGPPARELEQVYLQRADLEKQVLALRHALTNERKTHAEERAKLRTALETCLEMAQSNDPWERIETACKAAGLTHGGYNDGEPIYNWGKP
jgi:hypothetical protein